MQLRPYQQQTIDAFYDYYKNGNGGHGILVLPTAAGKSVILGKLITEIVRRWPTQRIILLSHVKELIEQNHQKIIMCWDKAPAGIYNAALNKRQPHHPIVVASIQSVYKRALELGHRDLLFIDECHLLQPGNTGMYNKLINDLLAINPQMKICGASATDYRTNSGLLTEGEDALFNDVIIEIYIKDLLEQGYLTPPISKASLVQADMEGVKTTAGEFNIKEMAERFDQKQFMNAALDNDMQYMQDRKCIAQFCATVENAQHLAEGMNMRGVQTEVIHGEMPTGQRNEIITNLREGKLRAVASVGVITTGTDIPNIDCIGMFRATKSPGLYQQIIGRGFRVMYHVGSLLDTAEQRLAAIRDGGKPNFLVLDHGQNIERHGAITDVQKPSIENRQKRKGKTPRATVRICEVCRSAWPLETTTCGTCGNEMLVERDSTKNLDPHASDADIMGTPFSRGEIASWFDVDEVAYHDHINKWDGSHTFRVTYYCGVMLFNEWLHFESTKAFYRKRAVNWWGLRSMAPLPDTVADAMRHKESITAPLRIQVHKKTATKNNSFYEVLRYEFQPAQQELADISTAERA